MDNINRGFGYGQHDLEFTERYSSPDNIQNFSATLLQNSQLNYLQQQRNLSREVLFGHQPSTDIPAGNPVFTTGQRYPSVTLSGSTNAELSSLSDPGVDLVTSINQQRSSQTLPHISGFMNPSLPLFRPPVSIQDPNNRQIESRGLAGFSSIIASAASHISTMDIPPPLIDVSGRQSSSPCLQQSSTPPLAPGFVPGIPHVPRLNFMSSAHQHPIPPVSSIANRLHNPDLSNFPHIPPINLMPPFLEDSVGSRSNSNTSHTNSTASLSFPFRHLQAEDSIPSIDNLDGDQQVPNAVMSPASGCSSPSIRNATAPFMPQNVIPFPPRNPPVSDSPAALRNELSFADSTFVDSEICKSLNSENSNLTGNQDSQGSSENSQARERTNIPIDLATQQNMSSFQQNLSLQDSVIKATTSKTPVQVNSENVKLSSATVHSGNLNHETISPVKDENYYTARKHLNVPEIKRTKLLLGDGKWKYGSASHKKDRINCQKVENEAKVSKGNNSVTIKTEPKVVQFLKKGTLCNKRHLIKLKNFNRNPKCLNTSDVPSNTADDMQFEFANSFDTQRQILLNSLIEFNRNVIVESNPTVDSGISCLDDSDLNSVDFDREESGAKRRKGKRPAFFHLKNEEEKRENKTGGEFNDKYLVKSESEQNDLPVNFSNDDSMLDNIRSPKHPFAITSPSFNKAAAKAVMTTTVADNATLITVSIMNKKSGKNGKTNTVSVNKGSILSPLASKSSLENESFKEETDLDDTVENETETEDSSFLDDDIEASGKSELGIDKLSIMSKLKREKEESSSEPDRMEINIRIDDSQLIQQGEQKRWQCLLCTKSYTTKHNLVTHVLDHNGIKPHLCMVCGKYFKQLSHLNTHMLTHDHLKPHVCQVCGKGFTQISHLKRHQAVHLEAKPYICDICNRGFAYPSELRSHKEKHVQGKNKCEECGEDFDSPKSLKNHMMTHENGDELICKYCNKVFRYPSQLKDHLLSHVGTRPYICTECGMDFMKEHHLKAHQFTHTGLRPYECPECGRSFNQKANMQRHMLIHNATRAFRCEECGKTFTQPQTLKAHKVVHFDTKPHQCKICGKQFGRLHNLQGHLHMHNNTKPYVCFCGSSFTLKGNLNRHKKVKHGLNESTESMEEEAVNFLSTLSERARTSLDDEMNDESEMGDLEPDLNDSENQSSLDSKSPRKGRKSVPRKIPLDSANSENQEMLDDDDEEEEEYDIETENFKKDEKIVSPYFDSHDGKQEVELKKEITDSGDDESETKTAAKLKSSLRKRKAKEQFPVLNEEEFESEKEDGIKKSEEEDDVEWTPIQSQTKRRKSGKAAKLDSIIEQKFKKA